MPALRLSSCWFLQQRHLYRVPHAFMAITLCAYGIAFSRLRGAHGCGLWRATTVDSSIPLAGWVLQRGAAIALHRAYIPTASAPLAGDAALGSHLTCPPASSPGKTSAAVAKAAVERRAPRWRGAGRTRRACAGRQRHLRPVVRSLTAGARILPPAGGNAIAPLLSCLLWEDGTLVCIVFSRGWICWRRLPSRYLLASLVLEYHLGFYYVSVLPAHRAS